MTKILEDGQVPACPWEGQALGFALLQGPQDWGFCRGRGKRKDSIFIDITGPKPKVVEGLHGASHMGEVGRDPEWQTREGPPGLGLPSLESLPTHANACWEWRTVAEWQVRARIPNGKQKKWMNWEAG